MSNETKTLAASVAEIVAMMRADLKTLGGFENGLVNVPAFGVREYVEKLEAAISTAAVQAEPAAWLKHFPGADKPTVVPGDTFLAEDALFRGWRPLAFADDAPATQPQATEREALSEERAVTANSVMCTAPARIWLNLFDTTVDTDGERLFPEDHEGVTWAEDEVGDYDVQYIRADLAGINTKG